MKINLHSTNVFKNNNPSFGGYLHKKSDYGSKEYVFNYPYDANNYEAFIEFFSVNKDANNEHIAGEQLKNEALNTYSLPLNPKGTRVNLNFDYGLNDNDAFAYRYKLVNRHTKDEKYMVEAGNVIENDGKKTNLVIQSKASVNKGGSMLLVIPDSYNVGYVYDEEGKPYKDNKIYEYGKNSTRTFANKFGGTLAGIENNADRIGKQGYTRIVSTPIFTDDSLSSHSYWNKNIYQMTSSLGNINNYASLQRKLFKNDINFVADGAFVNEGLEGIHFKNVLKWGEKSPYYEWFRAEGIKNGPLSLGVFSKNQKFINHKVVNSPYEFTQDKDGTVNITKNPDYKPNKETYIQIFDNRLVTDNERKDKTSLIKTYSNLSGENPVEINTHNDTIIPYSFEIQPETYLKGIERLNEYNSTKPNSKKIFLGTPQAARFLTKTNTFQLEDKFESGFETWDANTDIGKLNFVMSNADVKSLKNLPPIERREKYQYLQRKNYEVQDYVISSGKYWTRKTSDILLEHTAQELKEIEKNPNKAYERIMELVDEGKLPKSVKNEVSKEVVENVLNGEYKLKRIENSPKYRNLLTSSIMDLPLESIELGDDIVSVFGYPCITKRASKESELGVSRFDLHQKSNPHISSENAKTYNKTDAMYTQHLMQVTKEIISEVNHKLTNENKITDGTELTTFGQYILPIIEQDIAKFAIIRALSPKENIYKVNEKTGEITYNNEKLKGISLKKLGINETTPETEANALITKISNGIDRISETDKKAIADSIYKRIKDTNANGFMLSEMILDRTQAGLNWRIDAAKDIADIDAIRNLNSEFGSTWKDASDFWRNFTTSIYNENPNSYIAAEVTDEWDLSRISNKVGRYKDGKEAARKFLQDSNVTTSANYSYFFTDVQKIFSKNFETGDGIDAKERSYALFNKLVHSDNYLQSAQLESLLFSYTFTGNHDKPRALHCLALDMGLFYGDMTSPKYKNVIANVLNESDTENINYEIVSSKAIAMGKTLKNGFNQAIEKTFEKESDKRVALQAINKAIADLAKGSYLGENFAPDSFGVKPFDKTIDMVIKQAERHDLDLRDSEKKELINNVFETVLKPAMTKFEGLMTFLVALPGNPTMFAGDELGLTGYDEKCKNVYLQNRSILNWDILEPKNRTFVKDFHDRCNNIMKIRSNPRLQPLNTGTPYVLALQKENGSEERRVTAILRQNPTGEMVIAISNPVGVDLDETKAVNNNDEIKLDKIAFKNETYGDIGDRNGLQFGLKEGTTFYDSNSDKYIYKVVKDNNEYCIKKYSVEDGRETNINIKGRAMFLTTKHKMSEPSFTGSATFNIPQYNALSNPYAQNKAPKLGINLLLVK